MSLSVPVLAGARPDGAVDAATARAAAHAWLSGGLVALPTETVYGLAADAEDPDAVARIYAAKGRPADHPLIVHVAGIAALDAWSAGPSGTAHTLAAEFWPGPLTVVVARSERAGDHITGGQDTVALRCPGHPVALACLQALAELTGDPARGVAAPSANRFGRVSPTVAADVLGELGAFLDPVRDLIVDGGASAVGVESTIVDCTAARATVLRPGAITQADIDRVVSRGFEPRTDEPASGAARTEAGATVPSGTPRAPGMLESHYAPAAAVMLVSPGEPLPALADPRRVGLIALRSVPTPESWTRLGDPTDAAEYAHRLYAALRRADALGLSTVVAVLPSDVSGPLAAAVRDRLGRAAHPHRIGA